MSLKIHWRGKKGFLLPEKYHYKIFQCASPFEILKEELVKQSDQHLYVNHPVLFTSLTCAARLLSYFQNSDVHKRILRIFEDSFLIWFWTLRDIRSGKFKQNKAYGVWSALSSLLKEQWESIQWCIQVPGSRILGNFQIHNFQSVLIFSILSYLCSFWFITASIAFSLSHRTNIVKSSITSNFCWLFSRE